MPMHIDCELNPFNGKPFFNEVVFFHSKIWTLLTTDTFWNYPRDGGVNVEFQNAAAAAAAQDGEGADYGTWELAPDVWPVPTGSALWKFGMDKIFRPFYVRLMVGNRDSADEGRRKQFVALAEQMVYTWDVQTLVPAHGDIIRGRELIRTVLVKHFDV